MSPRKPDPATALRLVEVTARLLAEEGEPAVSARRVASEAGASTMAVYTHYGSMDQLLAAVRREGFHRFGLELDRPAVTADPVADLMAQGWGYRHFALHDRHLYQVMFRTRLADPRIASAEDAAASMATFGSLTTRLQRCTEAGRLRIDDLVSAGEVVWATAHGHSMIELSGYYAGMGRDPVASYAESLLHLAIGFGDDPAAARASLTKSRTRARRAGQLH
jgi:AcrR family transcriptional regulator